MGNLDQEIIEYHIESSFMFIIVIIYLNSYSIRAVKHRATTPSTPSGVHTCSEMEDLPVIVFDMLYQLGPGLHHDPVLMAKLLRLGRIFLKEWASIKSNGDLPSQRKVSRSSV